MPRFDSAERFLVRSRVAPILAGLITLSMVTFGQVCAFSTIAHSPKSEHALELETASAAEEEHGTCTSEGCEGEGEDEGHCPSGAATCCSTWAPPTAPLSVPPPTSTRINLADAWMIPATSLVLEDGAQEVALFKLDRPPGRPTEALLVSSQSRRGPPALF